MDVLWSLFRRQVLSFPDFCNPLFGEEAKPLFRRKGICQIDAIVALAVQLCSEPRIPASIDLNSPFLDKAIGDLLRNKLCDDPRQATLRRVKVLQIRLESVAVRKERRKLQHIWESFFDSCQPGGQLGRHT